MSKQNSNLESVEIERKNFSKLIAINPNYFGNLDNTKEKPVKKIIKNTAYEEITCVGYNLAFETLEATISIKKPFGYNGNLCSNGSYEHIRFFINYGSGWQDLGYTSINVHDIPTSKDCNGNLDKPLIYVASFSIDPKTKFCKYPVVPRVRAILSWNIIPDAGNENWLPIWGDIRESNIQLKPRKKIFVDFIDDIKGINPDIVIPIEYSDLDVGPFPDPPELSLEGIASMYKDKQIEESRFGLKDVHEYSSGGFVNQNLLIKKIDEWTNLKLDFAKTVEILEKLKANTSYEEIECLGLDYKKEFLVATIKIKKPYGYLGNLCTKGSKEYVSFWADWDNQCKWTFLGIKEINVHDLETSFPADGIYYSAVMPVDLSNHRNNCNKPKISRIRAVLSWNIPPSITDPDDLQYWGNILDAHVQIKPGDNVPPNTPPRMLIGGIHVNDIDNGTGTTVSVAKFASEDVIVDSKARQCPFGGRIDMKIWEIGSDYVGQWYKITLNNIDDSTIVTLNNDISVQDANGFWHNVPRIGNYYQLESFENNPLRIIQRWHSSGNNRWTIHIEFKTLPSDLAMPTHSIVKLIQLDNTAPIAPGVPGWELLRDRIDIHIDSGGDCKKFSAGDKIVGNFVARDKFFGSFSFGVLPSHMAVNQAHPVPNIPGTTEYLETSTLGNQWELDTTGMEPCGYVVRLTVSDRAIINSTPGYHNLQHREVGFCLE